MCQQPILVPFNWVRASPVHASQLVCARGSPTRPYKQSFSSLQVNLRYFPPTVSILLPHMTSASEHERVGTPAQPPTPTHHTPVCTDELKCVCVCIYIYMYVYVCVRR